MNCEKCGSDKLSFMAHIIISSPIRYFNKLSKKAIASKDIKIWGVDWDKVNIICGDCGYSTLSKRISEEIKND